MGYFDNWDNVQAYIRQAQDHDGRALVAALRQYLPAGAKVLELGMGPGSDLLLLRECYQATGSDASALFLEAFRRRQPGIPLLRLDAASIKTAQRFDGIYSNKVLHLLTRAQLRASFARQAEILLVGGIALHSFWHGDDDYVMQGQRTILYRQETLRPLLDPRLELVACQRYAEIEAGDSFYILLRKPRADGGATKSASGGAPAPV